MAHRFLAALLLVAAFFLTVPANAQQAAKPFTQEQVHAMVRDGLGDETGAKAITERGIDFAPTEEFIQNLKTAGASEAFLAALRAAEHPGPANAQKPINQIQVFALLASQVPSHRVAALVHQRGVDFEPTNDYLQEVRLAGGEDELISALKSAKVTKPVTVDPATQARQAQVQQHVARGAELEQKGQYAQAEQEYRAALLLDYQNADLYAVLAVVLGEQEKWDDAVSAGREAVRLNPEDDAAHDNLGVSLGVKHDWNDAISEFREALRLNPDDAMAHVNLGMALGNEGNWDGVIAEEHQASRLDPNNDMAHNYLGWALGHKGDSDGEIAEYREALRLNPSNDHAHMGLGEVLANNKDWDGAIAEFREVVRLKPNNAEPHYILGLALELNDDRQGALHEFRAAHELKPYDSKYREAYEQVLPHNHP